MRITVVIDNMAPTGAPKPFLAEHGLSLLIETKEKTILMDTGQTGAVVRNLSLLGIHPKDVDTVVLSHGHHDHAGGLAEFLRNRNRPVPVIAHPGIFSDRYSVKGDVRRYAGIPFSQAALTSMGAEWLFTDKPVEVCPGLWFSGQIPRQTDYEQGDGNLVVFNEAGCACHDVINDDAVLYYQDTEGLVVISGCAHSGLVNIVRNGLTLTGAAKLKGWIGGTHLGPVADGQKTATLDFIDSMNVKFLAANHCTGFAVMSILQQRLGQRFIPGFVGTVIDCSMF